MCAHHLLALVLAAGLLAAGQAQDPGTEEHRKLKTRTGVANPPAAPDAPLSNGPSIVPAGTSVPIQLRQPLSTETAQPGDPVYAQTTFPIMTGGRIVIPAGTWVQGVVDSVKRAGRVKGTAEMQFHLTTLIYSNGYTLDITPRSTRSLATRLDREEPGTVKHDAEKAKTWGAWEERLPKAGRSEFSRVPPPGTNIYGLGIGGVTGMAAGTLIALLARGGDVQFDTGTAVEIALTRAMAIQPDKIGGAAGGAAGEASR